MNEQLKAVCVEKDIAQQVCVLFHVFGTVKLAQDSLL